MGIGHERRGSTHKQGCDSGYVAKRLTSAQPLQEVLVYGHLSEVKELGFHYRTVKGTSGKTHSDSF